METIPFSYAYQQLMPWLKLLVYTAYVYACVYACANACANAYVAV